MSVFAQKLVRLNGFLQARWMVDCYMQRSSSDRPDVPLTALRNGQTGTVTSIEAGHGRGWGKGWGFKKRLMDLGLTPGTKVTVVKSAPFRGPIEILVRGSRLALGRGMAERILVEIEKQ